MLSIWLFFFQAEDGIRDLTVTGVQTCALPIWIGDVASIRDLPFVQHGITLDPRIEIDAAHFRDHSLEVHLLNDSGTRANIRSEERRVGKECRSRWSPYH